MAMLESGRAAFRYLGWVGRVAAAGAAAGVAVSCF